MRAIDPEDVQKGDTLKLSRTIVVSTDLDSAGDFKDQDDDWVILSHYDFGDKYTLELVSRPLPPLPTKPGSVVDIDRIDGGDARGLSRWMLLSNGNWHCASGGFRNSTEFAELIDTGRFTMEVVG